MMKMLCSLFVLILVAGLSVDGFGQPQNGLIVYLGDKLTFDGKDQSIYLGNQFKYQKFTISAWIRPGARQTKWAAILDNNHRATQSFAIHQHAGATNNYVFGIHSVASEAAGVYFSLLPGSWTHMILIKNHDSLSAYQNGKMIDSKKIPASYTISYDGRQVLHLGRWGAGGRYWNGEVYHVRIYNRALSKEEVSELWKYEGNQGSPPNPTVESAKEPH